LCRDIFTCHEEIFTYIGFILLQKTMAPECPKPRALKMQDSNAEAAGAMAPQKSSNI
jgi:hypothetical protein